MGTSDEATDPWQDRVNEVAAAVSELQRASTVADRDRALDRYQKAQRAAFDLFERMRGRDPK